MTLNPDELREDFPILEKRGLVYLDNAATTQKPRQVIDAVAEFYREFNANVHRGLHRLSQKASSLYEDAHETVARFIGASDWREVVFTKNTTEALNMIAQAIAEKFLRPGDEVVTTIMEHNSSILPWVRISRLRRLKLKIVSLANREELNYEELSNAITSRTKVVALTHVSNVLGCVNDIKRVVKEASQAGAFVVVDAAQSVPHMPVSVRELGVDALAFSGHKMLGPMGIGALYLREDLANELPSPMPGGGMVSEVTFYDGNISYVEAEPPWKFEAGTPNVAGAVGLAAAIGYLSKIGRENVEEHSRYLADLTVKRLREALDDRIVVYGPMKRSRRLGIVAFNVEGINPHLVASYLDSRGIAVRSGYHCAQHLHGVLGAPEGSVRASFYVYNTRRDVDKLVNTLVDLVSVVGRGSKLS